MKTASLFVLVLAVLVFVIDIFLVVIPLLSGEYVHPQLRDHLWTTPFLVWFAWWSYNNYLHA